MISLLQRVSEARVTVDATVGASIGRGLLVFVAIEPADTAARRARMVERISGYRVFPDEDGRMNQSLADTGFELLLVPQFTLAANTAKGTRASFTGAASPAMAREYFELFVAECAQSLPRVECGVFGADMQVMLINDGPVTFWLEA